MFYRRFVTFEAYQRDHFVVVSFVDCFPHFVFFASFCKKLPLVFRHQPGVLEECHDPAGHASRYPGILPNRPLFSPNEISNDMNYKNVGVASH